MKCNAVTRIGALGLTAVALFLSAFANLDKELAEAVVGGSFVLLGALRSSTQREDGNHANGP